jgi:general nucleoside transport system ATP-binding protein
MRGIRKQFGSLIANDTVDFELADGEIHALLGENGAGKTTLMNILYGLYEPDAGSMTVEGREVQFVSPRDAIAHGIGMVHQHFMLVPALTVLENLVLGMPSRREPLLDLKEFRRKVIETAERYKLTVDLDALVSQLPVGIQQRVEILKALFRGARTLILDEPTAVLTPQEVDEFFVILRRLKEDGHSTILITHKLREVKELSDRVTVLRGGRLVGVANTADLTTKDLARMMVGRDIADRIERAAVQPRGAVLELQNVECLNARNLPALRGISLTVRRGEIVGLAGVDGNGQGELAEVIAGMRIPTAGRVTINGRDCTDGPPLRCIQAGLGHVPEDRVRTGLVGPLSIADNLLLQMFDSPQYAKWGTIQEKAVAANAKRQMQDFDIRAPSADTPVGTLSGGNKQKVILAREFSRQPDLLLTVQPTRGVDIGATQFVHGRILEARANGTGVLLISTELDEILALSDRIGVMFEGRIVGVLEAGEATRERIGMMMAGQREAA